MKFLKEKKINSKIMIAIMYVSMCFAYWLSTRNSMALMSLMLFGSNAFVNNEIVAFIVGGIIPTIIYEFATRFVFRTYNLKLNGHGEDMRYDFRFFYIIANLLVGGAMLFSFGWAYLYSYLDIFAPITITTIFVVLFVWYVCKTYLEKHQYAQAIMAIGMPYMLLNVLLCVMPFLTRGSL